MDGYLRRGPMVWSVPQLCGLSSSSLIMIPTKVWRTKQHYSGTISLCSLDCHYAITLIDYCSKWPVAFTSNGTSGTVTAFSKKLFSREGNPLKLVTDNGFLGACDIKHYRSANYYAQSTGEMERWNRSVNCLQSLTFSLLIGLNPMQ